MLPIAITLFKKNLSKDVFRVVKVDIKHFNEKTKNNGLFLISLTLRNNNGSIAYYSCKKYGNINSVVIKEGSEVTMFFLKKSLANYNPRVAKIEGYDLSDSLITYFPYVALGVIPLLSAVYTLFN
ncbi:hypothetical protein [Deefgea piscis]|uniref:hypothetical protein n=1 Tax=Deefgea piscis TaxID=2739061 RepID=UPI001C81EB7C|nr:hypothetical protein [Deefgea piscis]QZA80714.1 hypothetical protein K4H25_14620 [Deefgea piscis]